MTTERRAYLRAVCAMFIWLAATLNAFDHAAYFACCVCLAISVAAVRQAVRVCVVLDADGQPE